MAGLSPRDFLAIERTRPSADELGVALPTPLDDTRDSGASDAGGRSGDGDGQVPVAARDNVVNSPSGEESAASSSNRKRHVPDEPNEGAEPPAAHHSSYMCTSPQPHALSSNGVVLPQVQPSGPPAPFPHSRSWQSASRHSGADNFRHHRHQ